MIFSNKPFSKIWLAGVLSLAGTQVSRIALILFLFKERGTVIDLAILVILDQLPGMLIACFAGAVIDRGNRRRIMIAADLCRAASMLVVMMNPTLPVIYCMAALNSMATACFQPAATASIPLVVKPSQLTQANAWQQAAQNVVYVLAPPIGAYLLVKVGLKVTLTVDMVSYLVSAALLMWTLIPESRSDSCPTRNGEGRDDGMSLLSGWFGGWSYLIHHRLERHLAIVLFFATLCPGLWTPIAPFFIRDFLHGSDELLGLQFGAFGLGAAAGAIVSPFIINRFGKGRTIVIAMVGEAAAMIVYSVVPQVAMSLVVILVWGIITSQLIIPYYSILQIAIAEEFQGRALSVLKQLQGFGTTMAMVMAVVLVGSLDSHVVLLTGGVVYLCAAGGLAFSPSGRILRATL